MLLSPKLSLFIRQTGAGGWSWNSMREKYYYLARAGGWSWNDTRKNNCTAEAAAEHGESQRLMLALADGMDGWMAPCRHRTCFVSQRILQIVYACVVEVQGKPLERSDLSHASFSWDILGYLVSSSRSIIPSRLVACWACVIRDCSLAGRRRT